MVAPRPGESNPYQSPQQATVPRFGADALVPGIRARRTRAGVLYRRIEFQAPLEMTLEFDGRSLRDVVRVDRQVTAWNFSWWRITPRLDFEVQVGDKPVALSVHVRLGRMARIRSFEVLMDGISIYTEGTGPDVRRT